MKILALYAEDYPWDVRIEKLLSGFAARRHAVRLICRNRKGSPREEVVSGFTCRRVVAPALADGLRGALSVPAFFNPVWSREVRRAIRLEKPDVLLVRDLPLAPLAVGAGRRSGLPVLVDFAENHPAMWRNVCRNSRTKLRAYLSKNPALARRMEKHVVARADHFFVVVEEMRDHLLALGADPAAVTIVSNTPDLRVFDAGDVPGGSSPAPAARAASLELLYVGHVTRARGLPQIVDAMALLRQQGGGPAITFHVVGEGVFLERLRQHAASRGLADAVVFHGWVPYAQVPEFVGRCDVGVIPHLKTEHTDTTVPNKLFEFMACRKPVLVSNTVPMARIVHEHGCGRVFRDGEIDHCAESLLTLLDPGERHALGQRGRQAIEERYNWSLDFERAAEALEGLARAARSGN
jgi:glycosyltransferase involved in cell wall biosynthesis